MSRYSRPDAQPMVYWLLVGAVMLVALGGYAGYVLYPRFDLSAGTGLGLLALASAAGIASFFSPCSFPLLVTTLAREAGAEREGAGPSLSRAVGFAASLAFGASVFLVATGLGIALGADAAFESVTFTSTSGRVIRTLVGLALIFLGLVQTNVLSLPLFGLVEDAVYPLRRAQAQLRRRRPALGFALLGFGYLLAGFG